MGCGVYRTSVGLKEKSKKTENGTKATFFHINLLRNPKRKGLYPINEANPSQELSLLSSNEFLKNRFTSNPNITAYQSENMLIGDPQL